MSAPHALATMIIAIDGPAGSGKSTVARRLAAALGLTFLDTGAMYRAVTLAALERGVEPMDEAGCGELARLLRLEFDADGRIRIDGKPGEPAIRSDEVTRWVSAVSAHPRVRGAIVPQQRAQADRGLGIVAEGRDIGTVVFPRADFKFFLTASAEERARRRSLEKHEPERFHEFLADIQRRDHHDSTRHDSPLKQANDARLVDTDDLGVDGVVAQLLEVIRGRAG